MTSISVYDKFRESLKNKNKFYMLSAKGSGSGVHPSTYATDMPLSIKIIM